MTPETEIYELYEEVKQELCRIDNLTPEQYQELMNNIAEDLGI